METVILEPIKVFFCNINKEMNLGGHCHYAEVIPEFETLGAIGFPSFHNTNNEVKDFLQGLNLKGFKGTNEDVLRFICKELNAFHFNQTKPFNCKFRLHKVILKVMGVRDENNHADGFTTYTKIL